jgi:hypothetical protein
MTKKNITGRDDDVIEQALAYAIETIDRLPDWMRQQEAKNREDMESLLRAISADPDRYRAEVQRRLMLSQRYR